MQLLKLIVVCFLVIMAGSSSASDHRQLLLFNQLEQTNNSTVIFIDNPDLPKLNQRLVKFLHQHIDQNNQRKVKITASILALTLGPFGVHRLYLGTTPLIPVVYVATVGGGVGILPFIDFVAIVFSKDISPFLNNNQIFMWVKK